MKGVWKGHFKCLMNEKPAGEAVMLIIGMDVGEKSGFAGRVREEMRKA